MRKTILITALAVLANLLVQGQTNTKGTDKQTKGEKVMEAIKNLPEDLLAQPETAPDTNANKIMNDNLSVVVNPLWREKGTTSFIEYKLQKCDVDPVKSTFPLGDKKLVQELTVNLNTIKKTAEEKKQMVLAQVQNHLTAYYKEQGTALSKTELADKAKTMIAGSEAFTTDQGRKGEVYYIHDIQSQVTGFIVLLLLPSADGKAVTFVQFNYSHYVYETTLPEDIMELRMFTYPEDQQEYINFTKGILKTLVVK